MGPNPLGDLLFGPQDPCGTFVDEGIGNAVMMGACGDGQSCLVNGQPGICANWQIVGGSSGDSNPSPTWAAFRTFFFTNPLPAVWNSFASENGCDHILLETFLKDVVPVPVPYEHAAGARDVLEVGSKAVSTAAYSGAISHAASAVNVLGEKGLLYPFKSSTFRSLLGISKVAEDMALPAFVAGGTIHAVGKAGWAAWNGECE